MEEKVSQRKTYLDILRIMACFLVCFNHSDGFHMFLEQEADGSVASWLRVVISVLTIVDIPMFFLISGGLLLGKEESYRVLFQKRIARFAVLLLFASAVTYAVTQWGSLNIADFIDRVFRGEIELSYWFLYTYLAFLFALPFMRKIARQLTRQDVCFLVVVRFFLLSLSLLCDYWFRWFGMKPIALTSYFSVPLSLVDFLFYPLVGHYLINVMPMEKLGKREIVACVGVLICGTAISAAVTYHEGMWSGFTQNYLGLFNYSTTIALFVIVRYLFERVSFSQKVRNVLANIGSVTIGIYLMEPEIGHYLYQPFFRTVYDHNTIVRLGYSVVWCLLCMTIGGAATYVLRKIPGVKKYL